MFGVPFLVSLLLSLDPFVDLHDARRYDAFNFLFVGVARFSRLPASAEVRGSRLFGALIFG